MTPFRPIARGSCVLQERKKVPDPLAHDFFRAKGSGTFFLILRQFIGLARRSFPRKIDPNQMLNELFIQNFALIENGSFRLEPGLNVITGETGAGKSIILQAIHLLLGGRASPGLIRTSCASASVEARFSFPIPQKECPDGNGKVTPWISKRLEKIGIENDSEGEMIIRRVISKGKNESLKSRIYINGQMVNRFSLLHLDKG